MSDNIVQRLRRMATGSPSALFDAAADEIERSHEAICCLTGVVERLRHQLEVANTRKLDTPQ